MECEAGLNFAAALESAEDDSDPGTAAVMSTAVLSPLFEAGSSLPSEAEAAVVSATATAVLSATMMESSIAAAVALIRVLFAPSVGVRVDVRAPGLTVMSVVAVQASVVAVEASMVVIEASVVVIEASVVVVKVSAGGSLISVPPLPSLASRL